MTFKYIIYFSLPILGWSLLDDKQTGTLTLLQERPRY